jgi:broad specificity phosphatase PhoE
MNDTSITNLLRELHGTLEGASSITEQDRELLRQLADDIHSLLAQPGAPTAERHQTVLDRLQAAVTRFEASHPDLTTTMALVSKRLSDMGI